MRVIKLTSRSKEDWAGKFVDDSNYDELLSEDCTVYKPDGTILLVLLKRAIPNDLLAKAWSVLEKFNAVTDNRGTASGTKAVPRTRKDGTKGKRTEVPDGWAVKSGVMGYFERTPTYPWCRACGFNQKEPEKFAKILPMIQFVSNQFKEYVPAKYKVQREVVEKSSSDFVIPGTVYTTITVNKNFRTACHLDAGDLPQGISGMAVIRQGKWKGCNLVLPDFKKAVQLDTGDLIFFDPHEFHGNTQLIPLSKDYQRCSIVFYYREKIQHCMGAAEEMKRVQNRKAGEALK